MTPALRVYRRSELEAVGDGCLYRFKKIWREGVSDSTDLSLMGIGLHKVKHRYLLRLVAQQIPQDVEEARAAFVEGIAEAQTPNRLIPEMRHLWDFHAERFELPLDQFLTAEERQPGTVTWAPDLVLARPTELEILDDKWGWQPPATEEELRQLFQARVYSCYAMSRWPHFPTYRFTLCANRFNRRVSVVFTKDDLDDVERELESHIATVESAEASGEWPAVPGPACRFCELRCPVVDTPIVMPKRLLTSESAQTLGGWVLAAEQMLRQGKKVLKSYCAAYGPVDVNGVVWDNRPTEVRSYPLEVVLQALQEQHALDAQLPEGTVTPLQTVSLSHSALEPVFRVYPKLEEALVAVVQSKMSWRFSARRAGATNERESHSDQEE